MDQRGFAIRLSASPLGRVRVPLVSGWRNSAMFVLRVTGHRIIHFRLFESIIIRTVEVCRILGFTRHVTFHGGFVSRVIGVYQCKRITSNACLLRMGHNEKKKIIIMTSRKFYSMSHSPTAIQQPFLFNWHKLVILIFIVNDDLFAK